jgi:glycosyltransferase involved in cell wall biosynthesis
VTLPLQRPSLVVHSGAHGGSNEVVAALLRHRPDGVDPSCILLEGGPMEEVFAALGARVSVLDAGSAKALWRLPPTVRRLRRLLRDHETDLVFAHVPKAHMYAAFAARSLQLPYLWWQHDPPQLKQRRNRVAAQIPAAVVVCSSEFTAAAQRARNRRIPVVAIHCGIETAGVEPREHVSAGAGVVGSVARLQRYKRHELLLRAAPRVLEQVPETRFRIVGGTLSGLDDGYPEELRSLAVSLGVAGAVDFTGYVPDAAASMGELDALVHCVELEPFGLVLVEAMLRGVPVIASREGGPAEIVRDGVDGILLDVTETEALATAIVRLLRAPEERTRLGAAGHARVLERFTAERMAAAAWALAADVHAGRVGSSS